MTVCVGPLCPQLPLVRDEEGDRSKCKRKERRENRGQNPHERATGNGREKYKETHAELQ